MIYQKIDGMDKPLARVIQGTIMLSRDRLDECAPSAPASPASPPATGW